MNKSKRKHGFSIRSRWQLGDTAGRSQHPQMAYNARRNAKKYTPVYYDAWNRIHYVEGPK